MGFGVLVLPVTGHAVLMCDTAAYRKEKVVADEIRPTRNLPAMVRSNLKELKLSTSRLGLVGSEVAPWGLVKEILGEGATEVGSADDILRRKKSAAEVALLRRAAEVAETGMATSTGCCNSWED